MATIGLDRLYYSKITEDANGEETYAQPSVLAKAITAELSVELVEAILYADDGAAEVVKDFNSGTLTLGVDDIGPTVAADLTGASTDDNGVLISASGTWVHPLQWGFVRKGLMEHTAIFGCIVLSLDYQLPTYRQRLIPLPFLHPPLKEPLCAGISWMDWASTHGKRKLQKVILVFHRPP